MRVIVKLSQTHFRNLMQHNFDIVRSLVGLMLGILRVSDPPLHRQITRLSIPPFFAISWLITWFAHDLPNHHNAQRMFDFFMANHPSAIVYAAAAVPMLHREELLMVDVEGPEVHQWLKKLPERIAPSLLILHTVKLMKDYPLDRINFSDSKLIRKTVYGAGIRKNSHIASLIVGSSLLVLLVSLVLSRYSFNNT